MNDFNYRIRHVGDKELAPAEFAYRIRRLAADAYHSLQRDDAALHEFIDLSRRIDELRQRTQDPDFIQIDPWLQNAKHLIESRRRLCTS
jgi:hypothetical protein